MWAVSVPVYAARRQGQKPHSHTTTLAPAPAQGWYSRVHINTHWPLRGPSDPIPVYCILARSAMISESRGPCSHRSRLHDQAMLRRATHCACLFGTDGRTGQLLDLARCRGKHGPSRSRCRPSLIDCDCGCWMVSAGLGMLGVSLQTAHKIRCGRFDALCSVFVLVWLF